MAGSINVNQNNNKVILKDQNPNITITDNVHEKIVNVTPATTKIVEVRTPGPQGPKGNTGATGSLPSGILSSSIQIASDISGAFNSVSSSLASEVSSLIDATSSYALSSQVSGSWQGFITSSGIISSSAFSSPSQGTVRAIINGTQTDVDTGLQTGDGVEFLNITASAITASSIKANTMEVIHLTSSFITASTVITTGSNVFGDEASDTHTFIGDIIAKNNITGSGYISTDTNITASGNISASGHIDGNTITSHGTLRYNGSIVGESVDGTTHAIIAQNEQLSIGGFAGPNPSSAIQISSTKTKIIGSVTASSDISASGTIIAKEIDVRGHITASGNISASGDFTGVNATFNQVRDTSLTTGRIVIASTQGLLSDDSDLTFSSDTLTVTKIANVNSSTHVTASGNISASNAVIGNSFKFPDNNNILSVGQLVFQNASYDEQTKFFQGTNGDTFLQSPQSIYVSVDHPNESTDDIFVIGDSVIPGVIGSIFFKVDSNSSISQINHITASGNISASGDIIGNINATHITASGNISASGEIEALDYKIAGGKSAIDYNSSNTRIIYGQNNQNSRLRGNTIELGEDATQHVTASGNISASGNIFGSVIKGGAPLRGAHTSIQQNVISVPGHINTVKLQGGVDIGSAPAEEPVIVSDNGLVVLLNALESGHSGSFSIYNATNSTTVPGVNSSEVFAIDKGGNITSSGNISSSGIITGQDVTVENRLYFGDHGGSNTFLSKTTNGDLIINNGGLATLSNITASGDISASGKMMMGTPGVNVIHEFYGKLKVIGSDVTIGNGHITASGNISSSGTVTMVTGSMNHLITDGSTIEFRNASTGNKEGTLKFDTSNGLTISDAGGDKGTLKVGDIGVTDGSNDIRLLGGNITASGDISASNNVIANRFYADGNIALNSPSSDKIQFAHDGGVDFVEYGKDANTSHFFYGAAITASGNISASGDMYADSIGIGTSAPVRDLHISKNASVYLRLQSTGNQNQVIEFFNNQEPDFSIGNYFNDGGLQIASDNKTFITVGASNGDKVEISGSLEVTSHTTASGNISASSTSTIQAGTGSFDILKGDTSQNTQLFVDGAITASNNISASGVVMGKNLNTEFIPIVPQDFNMDNVISTRDYAGAIVNDGGAATVKLQGFQVYATKMIPKGFTATSGSLFGSDVNNNVKWYSGSLLNNTNKHINSSKIDAGLTDTGSAYANGVVGDGITYVTVEWTPGTSDQVYGGKIYIKPS